MQCHVYKDVWEGVLCVSGTDHGRREVSCEFLGELLTSVCLAKVAEESLDDCMRNVASEDCYSPSTTYTHAHISTGCNFADDSFQICQSTNLCSLKIYFQLQIKKLPKRCM